MSISVAEEIQQLRSLFWSDRDPEGRVFAPLADAYRRQGDLDQAVFLLEEGLGRQADFAPAHVVSGWVRRDRGEPEAATRAFRAAIELDAENAEALQALAELDAPPSSRSAEPAPAEFTASAVALPAAADGPVTRTMADLYARQGLNDRALAVYRRLLERDPGDETLSERIEELELRIGGGRALDTDVEKLARDWAEGPRDTGELSTPFAWTSAAKPASARPVGPAARDYFRGLLEWEPGAPPAAEPEPSVETGEPVTAEPDVAFAAAPEIAPVATVAFALEEVALEIDAPVATLDAAPEPVVSIASLAPGAVPIASLAPDVVPIASLGPDASTPEQDFSSWYSRLR